MSQVFEPVQVTGMGKREAWLQVQVMKAIPVSFQTSPKT